MAENQGFVPKYDIDNGSVGMAPCRVARYRLAELFKLPGEVISSLDVMLEMKRMMEAEGWARSKFTVFRVMWGKRLGDVNAFSTDVVMGEAESYIRNEDYEEFHEMPVKLTSNARCVCWPVDVSEYVCICY